MRLPLLILFIFPFSMALGQRAMYEVRFDNTTRQLLTDAVCASHPRALRVLQAGTTASAGLAVLAEDGASGDYASELRQTEGVRSVQTGEFLSPGESGQINVKSRRRHAITCVLGMLVATNDGFLAFRKARLPARVGQSRRFRARVYDAGSEVNTESCDHVPGGPCDAHFVGVRENGVIHLHPGLTGMQDIDPARYSWPRRGVRGTITRVR